MTVESAPAPGLATSRSTVQTKEEVIEQDPNTHGDLEGGLRKSYGDNLVLDDIHLSVGEGTVFALLGPNGAGKTTMIQILSTLIGADAGQVEVAGHDLATEPDEVREP